MGWYQTVGHKEQCRRCDYCFYVYCADVPPFGGDGCGLVQIDTCTTWASGVLALPSPRQQRSGGRRNNKGQLVFAEAEDFLPTLSPPEMIARGVFGGCYFNPRGGKKGIFGRDVAVDHKEYPEEWFEGVPSHMYIKCVTRACDEAR